MDEARTFFTKRKNLIEMAQERGLHENDAKKFALSNIALEHDEAIKILDKHLEEIVFNAKSLGFDTLTITTPLGFTGKSEERTVPILDSNGFDTGKKRIASYKDIYNQKYSLVSGVYSQRGNSDSSYTIGNSYAKQYASGLTTLEQNLPKEGKATYSGVAFTHNKQGKLTYDVDFATKSGQGKITDLDQIGTITLEKGDIGKRYGHTMSIASNAIAEDWKDQAVSGEYLLDFYGPKAEEIAGKVTLSQNNSSSSNMQEKKLSDVATKANSYSETFDIGFGGTRGDIQK